MPTWCSCQVCVGKSAKSLRACSVLIDSGSSSAAGAVDRDQPVSRAVNAGLRADVFRRCGIDRDPLSRRVCRVHLAASNGGNLLQAASACQQQASATSEPGRDHHRGLTSQAEARLTEKHLAFAQSLAGQKKPRHRRKSGQYPCGQQWLPARKGGLPQRQTQMLVAAASGPSSSFQRKTQASPPPRKPSHIAPSHPRLNRRPSGSPGGKKTTCRLR